ncbi:MAG: hypothetical protein Q9162_005528 [Coniocarpon cinnabarinum]
MKTEAIQYYAVDTKDFDILTDRVWGECDDAGFPRSANEPWTADEVKTDYSALFGTEPRARTAAEQTAHFKTVMEKMDATQHLITLVALIYIQIREWTNLRCSGILPLDLDWSPKSSTIIDRDSVTVHANVQAWLRKRTADGETIETRNGCRGEFALSRLGSGLDAQWRVRWYKVFPGYDINGKEFWKAY